MKTKLTFLICLGLIMPGAVAFATTVIDNFDRTSGLGPNWTADPEYQITNNELANTRTTPDWTSLAVFNAVTNPLEVSFKWSSSGDIEGVNSGGIAARLESNSAKTSGYLILRRYGNIRLTAVINGVVQNTIHEVSATQPTPQPGDVIKVIISSDANGHHFDFYLNGVLDGRVTDAAKTYGNGATWYTGVSLFGNRNNNIDDFTVKYPSITVTSPNGGENWTVNTVQTIQWISDNYTGNVHIEYSTNGGTTWNDVVASTANTGSYPWIIPNTPSNSCLVKVSDAIDGDPWDVSNALFRISTAVQTITIQAPNGGENWIIGNNYNITWDATGGIVNVKIEYSTDNGTSWNVIVGSTANTGSYPWIPPAPPSGLCLVKISDASDNVPADVSDAIFSLVYSVKFKVKSTSGQPGTQNNPVFIQMNNPMKVKGVQFTLTDIPNLMTVPAPNGVLTTTRTNGFSVAYNETQVEVKVILYNPSGGLIDVGDGNILELQYNIDGGAIPGDSCNLNLSNVVIADENNQQVLTETTNGVFRFATNGDVSGPDGNPDGVVHWDDIDRITQIVLGDTPSNYELLVADLDNDGDIDLYDLLIAYDLITSEFLTC